MVKNLSKVLILAGCEFGAFISILVVATFGTQLYMQLGLGKLGLYIGFVNSFIGLGVVLFAPTLFKKFTTKKILIVTVFGSR